jgi:hypothetical protein
LTESHPSSPHPKRRKVFSSSGFQIRYAALVAGSLTVLLLFTGLHGLFVAKMELPADAAREAAVYFQASTIRVFVVGILYICIVTLAAVFLSHKAVGPVGRLEQEIENLVHSGEDVKSLKVREDDALAGLAQAINKLLAVVRRGSK